MQNETRDLYNAYVSRIAELNHVPSAATKFNVDPSVQQTLETHIQESSEFLKKINNVGVREQKGQKVGLGVGSTIASTTDTSGTNVRQPINPSALDGRDYECTQTNFDTAVPYNLLDAWAKFPDFQNRLRNALLTRQALDMICIGFNGVSRAATSDRATHPLLQDVNVGWLQKVRAEAPDRVMTEVVAASGKVNVYAGGDYENLDALVFDVVNELIDPWYREDTALVAVIGRRLFADKYFPLINQPPKATEMVAMDLVLSQKRVGGLQAVRVPYFPQDAIMITRLDNLSRYYQTGARRRLLKDEPERDRISNYESSNDAYVIEDLGCAALIENIATAP